MIALADVTLCCVDCATPRLALRALHASLDQCAFASALLLTDAPIADARVVVRRIAPIDGKQAYSAFVLKGLLDHVATSHVLLVQWDGYVIDGARWEAGFRDFDYIGAPWTWRPAGQQVGNGGFSLRSRRLLEALADPAFPPGHPEDALICRIWRPALEASGMRFAGPATARRFSVEMEPVAPARDGGPCFGFHGLHHLWRSLHEADLPELVAQLPAGWLRGDGADFLIAAYVARQRWREALVVLLAVEAEVGAAAAARRLAQMGGDGAALRAAIHARGAQ